MFTVIILSDTARANFDAAGVLFEPFEEAKVLAFCDWNQSQNARTLAQAVPGLREAIKQKQAWRAIVVDCPPELDGQEHNTDPANPFDFLDSRVTAEADTREHLNLRESTHPPVRLAHMLLGYPEMGVKRFEPVLSSIDPVSGARVTKPQVTEEDGVSKDVMAEYRKALTSDIDVQMQFREVEYSATEQAQFQHLQQQYEMKSVRPSEVVFITTREPAASDPTSVLRRAWRVGRDQRPSRFVERNDYPASCRFTVYDLEHVEHAEHEVDVLAFWLTVLCVSLNSLPPSALQAERLYLLDLEVDESKLVEALNAHLGRLASLRDRIDRGLRQRDRTVDRKLEEVLPTQLVPLDFERLGGAELSVSTGGYSLAADVPRSEAERWRDSLNEAQVHSDAFVRRPRRVLQTAVEEARHKARSFMPDEQTLSPVERDELLEDLGKRVHSIVQPAQSDIIDRKRLQSILDFHDEQVSDCIQERMRKGTIVIASAVVLAAWLGAFAPYLFQSANKGTAALVESLTVVAMIAGVLVLTGFVTLVTMRRQLLARIRALNSALRAYVSQVASSADRIAEHLSEVATYMYGQSKLRSSDRRESRAQSRRRELNALRKRINDAMVFEKAIVTTLGSQLEIERVIGEIDRVDLNNESELQRIFRLPTGEHRAEINQSGEMIEAPYDFVTRLTMSRVAVLEVEPSPDAAGGTLADV